MEGLMEGLMEGPALLHGRERHEIYLIEGRQKHSNMRNQVPLAEKRDARRTLEGMGPG